MKKDYRLIIARTAFLRRQAISLGTENVFSPTNIQYVSLKEIGPPFAGAFYVYVQNKYTSEKVEIGKLIVSNFASIQKAIDSYNKYEHTEFPSIRSNPLYYITNGYIKLSLRGLSSYRDLIINFLQARSARTKEEVEQFKHNPNSHLAEVVFEKDPYSLIMKHAALKYRIFTSSRVAMIK